MPERTSAGLLMYRHCSTWLEVFLAHPGGPFFEHKDRGHWTIPKGEVRGGEQLLETARREFEEETGLRPNGVNYLELGWIRQRGGKVVHAWAFDGDWPEGRVLSSGTFRMEWPPCSGRFGDFPEVDQVMFFRVEEARVRIKLAQWPFIERLGAILARGLDGLSAAPRNR